MHRAVMVVVMVGYAFGGIALGGIALGGHRPAAPAPKPAVLAAVWMAEARAADGSDRPMAGFDTCRAPSLHTMRVWRAKFSAAGIYIGGENMACAYGNLSLTWVRAVTAMGWSLLPNYVGPQPPCDSYPGRIRPGRAAAQGRAAADNAIADATMLGIGRGSPIYVDMEAYNRAKARCVTAVLTFLDAWTRQLNARGYVSGVYSSADAAIVDLRSATRVDGHRLAKPQCVWIALWDKQKNTNAPGYLARSSWPPGDRSKQYAGSLRVKVGGITMDVDLDLVDGPVVREHHQPPKHHQKPKHHKKPKRHQPPKRHQRAAKRQPRRSTRTSP
jgi:hypothetical protein